MQRYFIQKEDIVNGKTITLFNETNLHHIKNVMRMRVGDEIYCVLNEDNAYLCQIQSLNEQNVILTKVTKEYLSKELPVEVTIVQGLPKKNKMDLIVQKGTELGATSFVIFPADRSIAQWDEKKKQNKLTRLNKITEEASRQSHRSVKPSIQYKRLSDIIDDYLKYDILLFAHEDEAKTADYQSISKWLKNCKAHQKICIIIGPEGGFSPKEVNMLQAYEYKPVRLGRRILRTETAALYALSAISYELEER